MPNVKFIQGDIRTEETFEAVSEALDFQPANVVCSDAVADFMGDRFIDHSRTIKLNEAIIEFCKLILMPGGSLLMKIMRGPYEKELSETILKNFKDLQKIKPMASRN